MSTQDTNAPAQGAAPTGDNPPAPAAAEPSAPATDVTPPAPAPAEETVTVKKSDWDRQVGRQSALDRKEKLLERREKALARGEVFSFKQQAPAAPAQGASPAGDDEPGVATSEDLKAERMLIRLSASPEYREVLDADPTFRDLLSQNPLSLLPIYASDAIDAEDAVELMKEELNRRKESATAAPAAAPAAPAPTPAPQTVETGAPSVEGALATEGMQDKEYTEAIASGSTKGIAQGLAHRFAKMRRH